MDYVGRDKEAPAVIDVVDLPSPLKEEAQQIEARVSEELGPMRLETNLFMQKLIQSDQGNRIKTLITMVEREIKRLQIKRTLKGILRRMRRMAIYKHRRCRIERQAESWQKQSKSKSKNSNANWSNRLEQHHYKRNLPISKMTRRMIKSLVSDASMPVAHHSSSGPTKMHSNDD